MNKEDIKSFYDHDNHVLINLDPYYRPKVVISYFLGGIVLGLLFGGTLGVVIGIVYCK